MYGSFGDEVRRKLNCFKGMHLFIDDIKLVSLSSFSSKSVPNSHKAVVPMSC